uniref:Phosphatidylinositol-3,4-bisphosphate 4-phosphatase n=1 Tax=Denticeps clupeoides TaxID=299321 RepID=A0AAY4AN12_9TELE
MTTYGFFLFSVHFLNLADGFPRSLRLSCRLSACRGLVSALRDGKPNAVVQVAVLDVREQSLLAFSCTEIVQGTRDPLFLTGVTFPPDCPVFEEMVVKLSVYDVKDKSSETVRLVTPPTAFFPHYFNSFLPFSSHALLCPLLSQISLLFCVCRSSDDLATVGTVVVSRLKMGEIEDGEADHITADVKGQKCTLVCESLDGTTNDKDNGPLMNAVFKNSVYKVYRFQTVDSKWMLVREQMAECTLSFSIPKQLISLYIEEDSSRIQELRDLGELSPHWDNLRREVITRYDQVIRNYRETLVTVDLSYFPTGPLFKPSCSKAQKSLEFIPINLHTQRMRVTCPRQTDAFYDVITVGAPAAHFHGFKSGGLQRLLSRYENEKKSTAYQCIYYGPEQTAKAREVLSSVAQLQPLITSLSDRLLQAAQQHSAEGLRDGLKALADKTEQFVHALKDELVKGALLALHTARPGYVSRNERSPSGNHKDPIPHHKEYDEEEWDRVWANVAKSLNSVIAMVDKLQEQDNNKQDSVPEQALADVITSHNPAGDWREQLSPLLASLRESVVEVAGRAQRSMTFVLLQEAVCSIPQGLSLQQRRDVVFSQALAALACGFVMRLYAGLEDKGFLRQLHLVGVVAQFESLLSTYSEEIGMLEDMETGISDLSRVTFRITEAKSDEPGDLQPIVSGRRDHYTVEVPLPRQAFEALPEEIQEGKPLQVYPVLFNVGINEQQTIAERFGDISLQERINQRNFDSKKTFFFSGLPCFQMQTDIKELLETLGQNVVTKKRKNVEILWLAGTICRRLNGIRFTSCKSAKDRTSMSVTLEQCALLRDEHQLNKDYFIRALDCMRSRLTQGDGAQWDDPEAGSVANHKPASRHFYPIALLLVSSHLLVVWLILSLVFLLAKYQ